MQSARRKFHSTETALLKASNDILGALDQGSAVILVMLDLSSAFDTIDHGTMLHRLETDFGINGKALAWFHSYLEDRCQIVCIEGQYSTPSWLTCGVRQGSVLGPKELTLYTKHIGGIIREHGLKYHRYADDSQNYFAGEALGNAEVDVVLRRVEKCVADMRNWLEANMLNVNDEKAEVILFTPKHRVLKHVNAKVGAFDIRSVPIVRNSGALFDQHMVIDKQVHALCTSAYCHLRNISRSRR